MEKTKKSDHGRQKIKHSMDKTTSFTTNSSNLNGHQINQMKNKMNSKQQLIQIIVCVKNN